MKLSIICARCQKKIREPEEDNGHNDREWCKKCCKKHNGGKDIK